MQGSRITEASGEYSGGESGEGFEMIDLETREILQFALEVLKKQVIYMRRTHESYLALLDALRKDLPDLPANLQK